MRRGDTVVVITINIDIIDISISIIIIVIGSIIEFILSIYVLLFDIFFKLASDSKYRIIKEGIRASYLNTADYTLWEYLLDKIFVF